MIKETLSKNKVYIIIVIILLLYLGITYTVYKKNQKKENNTEYFVTNNSKYIYLEGNLKKIENELELNWKDYNVYIDNKFLGKYKLQYNNKWYVYNDQHDPIKYEGNVLAFTNENIKVYEFNRQDITQEEIERINSYLTKENINIVDYNTYDSKIEYDMDNDGIKEKIYRINSKINNNNDNIFSLILVEKGNKLIKVKSNVANNESYEKIMIYDLYGIINIDKDNELEIVITEMKYSQPNKRNEIVYKLKNNRYEQISE